MCALRARDTGRVGPSARPDAASRLSIFSALINSKPTATTTSAHAQDSPANCLAFSLLIGAGSPPLYRRARQAGKQVVGPSASSRCEPVGQAETGVGRASELRSGARAGQRGFGPVSIDRKLRGPKRERAPVCVCLCLCVTFGPAAKWALGRRSDGRPARLARPAFRCKRRPTRTALVSGPAARQHFHCVPRARARAICKAGRESCKRARV